jgi:four helix bundle protein
MLNTHKDLDVWKKAIEMVVQVYAITEKFPQSEMFTLSSQLRRSAISIPSNIAEGSSRKHLKEKKQFLHIALSSAAELDTQLIISNKLRFIDDLHFNRIQEELNVISKMLQGLIKSFDGSRENRI